MQVFTYQVSHLPDLDRTEYHARYGDDPSSKLYDMQDSFLHTIHTIGRQYPLCCSLVYSFNPDEPNQDRKLQIFIRLIFKCDLENHITKQVQKILAASFWHDFYRIEECQPLSNLDLSWVESVSFGVKQEEKISPTVRRDNSPSHYYSIQPFEPSESVDRVGFISKLETYKNRAVVEIIFHPTALTSSEQTALENLLRVLSDQTSYGMTTSEISGKIREKPIDPVAARTLRQFEDLQEAIQSQLLYEVSIRVLAESHFSASLLLNDFWVESSDKPLYREIAIDRQNPQFAPAISAFREGSLCAEVVWAEYWHNLPLNSPLLAIKRLHRLFTVEDLSACFRVVVPGSVVVFSGIPKETDLRSGKLEKSILLGWQTGKSQNQAQIPLNNLNKHVFVCGVPGSGKTTAVFNLLFQLWTEHNIPFLVIEPAKTEYRSMLNCFYDEVAIDREQNLENRTLNRAYTAARDVEKAIAAMKSDLKVYSLGNERVCPFRFNPFAFYKTTTLDEHISTLEGCFKAAMPLFGPLPALLAEAIEQVYAQYEWQPQDTAEYGVSLGRKFPTMQELYEAVTAILETKQYSADVAGDIKTALEVRIGGLLRRSVGSMLNTRISTPDIADLLSKPVILEMDSLNEEQANLMTMFILATLRQYTKVTRKSGSPLKHVVAIEEAHNIVGNDAGNNEEGAASPKAEATKYIVRMLAEMRALGQGIIIADQLPSAVSPEVIKNTNVKLAHRTVSGDDREILQQAMLLTGSQSEELARANPGDAYLFMEGMYKPVRIKEPNTKLIYGIEEPPSNEELVECIQTQDFYQEAISTKLSLYQDKVDRRKEIVKQQIENLLANLSQPLKAGNDLLDMSISEHTDVQVLTFIDNSLQEFAQGIKKLPFETNLEIDRLWNSLRQEGIFDTLFTDSDIKLLRDRLIYCKKTLKELSQHCQDKLQEINYIKQGRKLEQIYDRIKQCFELYVHQSDFVINLVEQSESGEDIQVAYQLVKTIGGNFGQYIEAFDRIENDGQTQLAAQMSDAIDRMTDYINDAEDKISIIL
jgi:Helicase HerA, central domain